MPADNSGNAYAFDLRGIGSPLKVQDRLTAPLSLSGGSSIVSADAGMISLPDESVNPLWYLLAVFAFLVIARFATEHENSGIDPKFMSIGIYNFLAVGIMATLFIVVEKIIINKWPVKGFQQLVNAV